MPAIEDDLALPGLRRGPQGPRQGGSSFQSGSSSGSQSGITQSGLKWTTCSRTKGTYSAEVYEGLCTCQQYRPTPMRSGHPVLTSKDSMPAACKAAATYTPRCAAFRPPCHLEIGAIDRWLVRLGRPLYLTRDAAAPHLSGIFPVESLSRAFLVERGSKGMRRIAVVLFIWRLSGKYFRHDATGAISRQVRSLPQRQPQLHLHGRACGPGACRSLTPSDDGRR